MKPYSRTIRGNCYIVDTPYGGGPNTATYQVVSNGYILDTLQVPVAGVTNGDHKSPNNHKFIHDVQICCYGSVQTGYRDVSGRGFRDQHGVFNQTPQSPLNLVELDTQVYNDALSKLNSKLRSEVDLSIDLFEGHQTVALWKSVSKLSAYVNRHPGKALLRSFRSFNDPKGSVKRGGALWLQYTYGVKPLAQDVYNAVIELARNFEPNMKIRVDAKRTSTIDYKAPWEGDSTVSAHVFGNTSDRCRIQVEFSPPSTWYQLLGNFTSLNPLSIAWELTPYSFVADWVLNVGGYLRNLETSLAYGNLFKRGFYTQTYRLEVQNTIKQEVTYSTDNFNRYDLSAKRVRSIRNRVKLLSYPSPHLPRFDVQMGSGRMLNAAALLSQFLRN